MDVTPTDITTRAANWRQDAQLVAVRVFHDDPRHVTLADVGAPGAEGLQALHLSQPVAVRHEVEVPAVPAGLRR